MFKQTVFVLFFITCVQCATRAQLFSGKNEVGIHFGGFLYQGDLASGKDMIKTARPAVGVYYSRILNNYFAFRGNLSRSNLIGNDAGYADPAWRRKRNFRFSTPVTEVSAMVVYNLLGTNGQPATTRLTPYVFAGAGYSFLNIRRNFSSTSRSFFDKAFYDHLALDSAHSLPGGAPVIPLGLGLKYTISNRWAVTGEGTYRLMFTDYLDGFSQAANPRSKDGYYSFTIGLVYAFGRNSMLDCPVFRR